MRPSVSLVLALSTCFTAATALPQFRVRQRAPATEEKKPSFSVVPLEPDNDGSDSGSGDGDGDGDVDDEDIVTLTRTVVQTEEPETRLVTIPGQEHTRTITSDPKTVTKQIPTTISVINVDDEVTETLTVTPRPTADISAPRSKSKTSITSTTIASPTTTAEDSKPTSASVSVGCTTVGDNTTAIPVITKTSEPVPLEPEMSTLTGTDNLGASTTESAPEATSLIHSSTPSATISPIPAIEPSPPTYLTTTSWAPLSTAPTTLMTSAISIQVPSEPSASPAVFDDGYWHTTYPWKGTTAS